MFAKQTLRKCARLSDLIKILLKGVFAKNEKGYRRNAKKKRFRSLLILLLSVASIRRKLLKTIHTEERSAHAYKFRKLQHSTRIVK